MDAVAVFPLGSVEVLINPGYLEVKQVPFSQLEKASSVQN